MQYVILEDDLMSQLTGQVERRIAAGWQLQGGVSAVLAGVSMRFYQAMVKP